ncbi:DUF2809 domain-containing protein [Streptococcus sobrinus]|uniref:DUF2809 domain-containing protein n=1 Tax=Streptococcus sobrinus TaxID=1310 RepID=UPI0020D1F9E5|nr:DUF2809 domain-containing protein [Streptococcus sobrinus]
MRFCWPKTALKKIALLALVVSLLDEFSQLIRWHWLVSFRLTTLGYLLLGQGFQWADLLGRPASLRFWYCLPFSNR